MAIHTCVVCGKDFEIRGAGKACPDCRQQYRKEYRAKWLAANPTYMREYNARYLSKATEAKRRGYKPTPEEQQTMPETLAPLPTMDVKIGVQTVTLTQCFKMDMRALHLPCGRREECYQSPRCPYIPDSVIPQSHRWNEHPSERKRKSCK